VQPARKILLVIFRISEISVKEPSQADWSIVYTCFVLVESGEMHDASMSSAGFYILLAV
jgi:hypothetical protein